MQKSNEDRGSPCLTPLLSLKKSIGLPLTKIESLVECNFFLFKLEILNPKASRTLKVKFQSKILNTFLISIFKTSLTPQLFLSTMLATSEEKIMYSSMCLPVSYPKISPLNINEILVMYHGYDNISVFGLSGDKSNFRLARAHACAAFGSTKSICHINLSLLKQLKSFLLNCILHLSCLLYMLFDMSCGNHVILLL